MRAHHLCSPSSPFSHRYDLPRTLTDHMTDILTALIDEAATVSPEVRKILLDQFDKDRPVSSHLLHVSSSLSLAHSSRCPFALQRSPTTPELWN